MFRARRSQTPTSRRIRAIAGGACVVLLLAGCGLFGGGSDEDEVSAAGAAFLDDWAAGRYPEAAARTTDPAKAEELLRKVQDTLRLDGRTFRPGALSGCKDDQPCVLAFDATLSLTALGEWSYPSALTLKENPDDSDPARAWLVDDWSPAVVHPKLTADSALSRVRELPQRAEILDRDGEALVGEQPVVRVGVVAGKIPDAELKKLTELLKLDYAGLAKRAQSAPAGQFVEAVVLRRPEYQAVGPRVNDISGVVTRNDTLPLAPTRQYARSVLGTVGPATKETLEKAGPTASSVDNIGLSGLQAIYQQQLAGTPGGKVNLVDAADNTVRETLHEFAPVAGASLQISLDKQVQDAAERALESLTGNASLVAIDTETGDILAVANSPADRAGDERALNGRYAPGSTFKIITTTALLREGLSPSDTVSCPPRINVGGKNFENYDGLGSLGDVPFSKDFTESCNTAFISKAKDLKPDALTQAANSFGIGNSWDVGMKVFSGDVPTSTDSVDQSAASIGQGRVLMSPLAMASVAATVASGTPRTPRLVLSGPPSGSAAPSPPESLPALPEANTLRNLMLATVSAGTASVLAIPGEQIGAKTGTAEYGSGDKAGLHAWMVGFLDHIAFAVIVEDGVTGAQTAGPIARQFLMDVRGPY